MDNTTETNGWCEALYHAKASGLVLYGRALGLSHSEAEDVVQETFLSLLQLKQRPTHEEYYCIRSFRNRALNCRRSLWRRVLRELESARWFEPTADSGPQEAKARETLERLPIEQREVIVLKIWNGLTFEEIGELLETSSHTVAGRYRYGIQKLRNLLKDQDYEYHRQLGNPASLLGATPSVPES